MTEPDTVGEARAGEPLWIVLAIVAALVAGAGCAHAIDPRIIEDAQTAVRVKSVLVNDAALGTQAIEVRVIRGVAHLSGVVTSHEESARAVALARAVAGVVRVEADLHVRPAAFTAETRRLRGDTAVLTPGAADKLF